MSGYHSFIYFAGFHLARVDGVIGGTGKKYFYHNDHLGSALAVTDEEGNKVIERDFLPFGEIINLQEGLNPYADGSGFTGKDWDEEIGLYYFNARWYDPEIGRFITEDPLMDEPNLYSYGFNNPIRYLDPTGMFNVSIPKVIIDFTDFATKTMDSFEKMISPILDPLQKAYETYDTIYRYVYNIITIIDPDNDILEELESIDAKFKPLRGAIKNWRNFKDKNKTTKYLSGAAKIWNELDRMGYSFFDAIRFLATYYDEKLDDRLPDKSKEEVFAKIAQSKTDGEKLVAEIKEGLSFGPRSEVDFRAISQGIDVFYKCPAITAPLLGAYFDHKKEVDRYMASLNQRISDINLLRELVEKNPEATATLAFIYIINIDKYKEDDIDSFRFIIKKINEGSFPLYW